MDADEFAAWKAETERSRHGWISDLAWQERGDLLLYKGGLEAGHVVMLTRAPEGGVVLRTGRYRDAVPHIAEAAFEFDWSKSFADRNEAVAYLLRTGGMTVLAALLDLPVGGARP